MNYNHTKNCRYCNKKFHSQRADARFCSSTCRVHFHQNKSNNIASCKTDENEFLNVSNISLNKRNIINEMFSKNFYTQKEIESLEKNKKKVFELFILSNQDMIEEMIYDLNFFSEDEYANLSEFTEKAFKILYQLEMHPQKINELLPKIQKLTLEYDTQ